MNEPISDTVRGILDGHISLSRELSSRNHYPAIDVLDSVSRVQEDVVDQDHLEASGKLKEVVSTYRDAEDLINIGAYEEGSNPDIDYALEHIDDINEFLQQGIFESTSYEQTVDQLNSIFDSSGSTTSETGDEPEQEQSDNMMEDVETMNNMDQINFNG
jgi:flagellum-specific ATP synthase